MPAVLLSVILYAPAGASGSTPPPSPNSSSTPLETAAPIPEAPAQRVLPPDLVALEKKLGELKLTSLRFSLHTRFTGRGITRGERQILSLLTLGSTIAGEETLAPAAANITLSLFGQPLALRILGNASWLYFRRLAAHDGGRPWLKLGPGGLAELFTVEGKGAPSPAHPKPLKPSIGQPAYAEPPFTKLVQALADAPELQELGPGTADGQAVTTFLATLRPGALGTQAPPHPSRPIRIGHRLLRLPPEPRITLEVSLAASGMPVRLVLAESLLGVTTAQIIDFPAVNFPLTIAAPAPAETITLAQLRALEKESKRHRHAPPRK